MRLIMDEPTPMCDIMCEALAEHIMEHIGIGESIIKRIGYIIVIIIYFYQNQQFLQLRKP